MEQIEPLANEKFQWLDDEGDIMEGTLNSSDILEFAKLVATKAYSLGFNGGHKMGSTGVFGEPLEDDF
jgi:hypothetical protein